MVSFNIFHISVCTWQHKKIRQFTVKRQAQCPFSGQVKKNYTSKVESILNDP